jgi:hypothetical protein
LHTAKPSEPNTIYNYNVLAYQFNCYAPPLAAAPVATDLSPHGSLPGFTLAAQAAPAFILCLSQTIFSKPKNNINPMALLA